MVFNLREIRTRSEHQAVISALHFADGNMSRCAELLGVSRPTSYDLMANYQLAEAGKG